MLMQTLRTDGATALKRLLYGQRGEPYDIGGHKLRFVLGTRPFRRKYAKLRPRWDDDVARYDALQQIFLAEHLKPGMFAVDVGAHVGQDSLMMAALCGSEGEVVAFEPDAGAVPVFRANLALNPGIKPPRLEVAAVSDRDGVAEFFTVNAGGANSSLVPTGIGEGEVSSTTVKTVTLDSYLTRTPDLVKIDIEGFEIRALQGARKLLASDATILCEVHPYAWPELGDSYETLKETVKPFGRRVRYLDQDHEPDTIPLDSFGYGITLLERV